MSVTLIRHTRPALDRSICYGRLDIDVGPDFETDALAVIRALPSAERLISSPLRRCVKLAEKISSVTSLPLQIDARISEVDFGRWEGVPWDDVPRAELDAWATDFYHARPHGGENMQMLHQRVSAALSDYKTACVPHIIVTHAGIIRAALAAGSEAQDDWNTRIPYGGQITL